MAEGPEVSEADDLVAPKECRPLTISEALDAVPLGRWHLFHLLCQVLAWMVFASSQEATAYAFPGLRRELGANEETLAHFASAFPLGCILGAVLAAALVDRVGRRTMMVVAAPTSAGLHLCMGFAASVDMLLVLRLLQAAAWSTLMTAIAAWYTEFLPTHRRGPLMAAVSFGWPLGRGTVILVARATGDAWRPVMMIGAAGFSILACLLLQAPESPRFLLAQGDVASAKKVLQQMSGSTHFSPELLCLSSGGQREEAASKAVPGSTAALRLLLGRDRMLLLYSIVLFGMLSITTVLIDNWGPGVFRKLLAPDEADLPHDVLALFNFGDFCGVVLSIILADSLGRRGSFMIGFFLQAFLLAAMAVSSRHMSASGSRSTVVTIGFAAACCRCFGWEAAHFWTLEAFATEIRGMAFGVATCLMRVFSVLSLEATSGQVDEVSPEGALALMAGLLGVGGVFATCMLPMETANAPMS